MQQATIQLNGAVMSIDLDPKQFKTGSTGYYGCGKLNAPDGKYQINVMLIKCHSKEK